MTSDDPEFAAEADAALVGRALGQICAEATTPPPLALSPQCLLRRARLARQLAAEKAAFSPISLGLPGAIAFGALAVAAVLASRTPATTAGSVAQLAVQAMLFGAMLAACALAANAWAALRARN